MNEDRLVEIETKMAFQEKTIKDLSDALYSQQKEIDVINKTLKLLVQIRVQGAKGSRVQVKKNWKGFIS